MTMSTIQQWGRKESIIWPPRGFVYTFGAFLSACIVLRHGKRKLQNERNDAKNELHREKPVYRHIFANPVPNPRVERLVLIVASRSRIRKNAPSCAACAVRVRGNGLPSN